MDSTESRTLLRSRLRSAASFQESLLLDLRAIKDLFSDEKCFCGGKIIPKKETRESPPNQVTDGSIYSVTIYRYCEECGLMYVPR